MGQGTGESAFTAAAKGKQKSSTIDEARKNLKIAVDLFLEEQDIKSAMPKISTWSGFSRRWSEGQALNWFKARVTPWK
jgi:hypothetical protein